MRFVKFYDDAGRPVYVDPTKIESFCTRDVRGGGTYIRLARSDAFVTESPNEVAVKLEEFDKASAYYTVQGTGVTLLQEEKE